MPAMHNGRACILLRPIDQSILLGIFTKGEGGAEVNWDYSENSQLFKIETLKCTKQIFKKS